MSVRGPDAQPGTAPAAVPAGGTALPSWLAATLVFLSSGAVLVLEVLSLRLIAPYIGVTLETSTSVIGAALAAIAFGAWMGGRVADLADPRKLLGPVLLLAGAATLLVLPLVRWTGRLAGGSDVSSVLLLATAAVFIPAALLSAVTPLVVKLQLGDLARTGSVVGRYSGIGTLGAILATFATGFVLVATLPSTAIVLGLGAVLVAAGLAVLVLLGLGAARGPGGPAILGVFVLLGSLTVLAPNPCQVETAYHCARVVADPSREGGRTLELDTLRHSYVDLDDPTHLEFRYVQAIASLADALRPPGAPVQALHLGGGGMTVPRYLAATRPGSESLVLEIDPGVVELDQQELGLRTGADLRVEVIDARVGLARQPDEAYDLVVGDAFGGVAVPWHLTTAETVRDVDRVLRADGVYVANVIDNPPNALVRAEVATFRTVFPYVAVVAAPEDLRGASGGNFVLLGSARPLPLDALRARLAERGTGYAVAAGEDAARFAGSAQPLTDERAPVDQLLNPYGS